MTLVIALDKTGAVVYSLDMETMTTERNTMPRINDDLELAAIAATLPLSLLDVIKAELDDADRRPLDYLDAQGRDVNGDGPFTDAELWS